MEASGLGFRAQGPGFMNFGSRVYRLGAGGLRFRV